MTKKHFIKIAAALASIRPDQDTEAYDEWQRVRETLIEVFIDLNPRFDQSRFINATEN
jgi:hypothetical protein